MIDVQIRATGIGGSEIAAIVGMDFRRDKFAVYAEKLGLVDRDPPNARMKWGKRIERVIAEAYADETKQAVSWWDKTLAHPERPWQVYSPDAFVTSSPYAITSQLMDEEITRYRIGGIDAKNVAWDQAAQWGESGTEIVPQHIALQLQWYCSAADLQWWDVAALFGGNDLRIYRLHRDPEIEAVLLTEAEKFWTGHVLARVPPPIGGSETAAAYLKKRFPKNIEALRPATQDERDLLYYCDEIRARAKSADEEKKAAENAVKERIADADGLTCDRGKVTWKKERDSLGVDWEAVARGLCSTEEECARLAKLAQEKVVVTREGARKIHWGLK